MNPQTHTALTQALAADLREAWATTRRLYSDQQLYGFGPYTSTDAGYFEATASSELGLQTVARDYADGDEASLPLRTASLRWSPCDSPLHLTSGDLPRITALLDTLDNVDEEVAEQIFEAALLALEQLDADGTFGSGEERASLTLCLWKGDQSDEERLAYVRRLNPPEVASRFEREQDEAMKAWETLVPSLEDEITD
jgi:hypothetical protein